MQHRKSSHLADLLDSFTREILKACQRHYAQCSKISAQVEAIERGTASLAERDKLFALLMEAVIGFELNARADVDAFRRVHHRVMRRLLDGHHDGDDQVDAFNACARALPATGSFSVGNASGAAQTHIRNASSGSGAVRQRLRQQICNI